VPLQIVAEIGDLVQSTTLSQSEIARQKRRVQLHRNRRSRGRVSTGAGEQVRYQQLGASTYAQADANGDRLADFSIALVGTFTLEADDFVL
jgi:hypothetical protein